MYDLFHKFMSRATRRLVLDSGWARRQFDAHLGQFRVLAYRGLVPDDLADRPWVPPAYVSVSQFDRQMALLAELGPARTLGDVLVRTQVEEDAAPAVCITFDDGMADNAELALPILREYGHAATFFVATGCIGGESLLLDDRVRLLRLIGEGDPSARLGEPCRRAPAEEDEGDTPGSSRYAPEVPTVWARRVHEIDPAALECLRLMTWAQVRRLHAAGMEIGAHTVNHVILGRQKRRTRRNEILESVARIRSKLGRMDVPFAFPGGLQEDYGSFDVDILAAIGVPYAVTARPGWNDVVTPALELRRNRIGIDCDEQTFLGHLYGIADPSPAPVSCTPSVG